MGGSQGLESSSHQGHDLAGSSHSLLGACCVSPENVCLASESSIANILDAPLAFT